MIDVAFRHVETLISRNDGKFVLTILAVYVASDMDVLAGKIRLAYTEGRIDKLTKRKFGFGYSRKNIFTQKFDKRKDYHIVFEAMNEMVTGLKKMESLEG